MKMFVPLPGEDYRLAEEATLVGSYQNQQWFRATGYPGDPSYTYRWAPPRDILGKPVVLPKDTIIRINALWMMPSWSKLISITLRMPGNKYKPRIYLTRDELATLELEHV